MDIWDFVEFRYSDDDEEDETMQDYNPPSPREPVTLEILINALTNTKLYKKYLVLKLHLLTFKMQWRTFSYDIPSRRYQCSKLGET